MYNDQIVEIPVGEVSQRQRMAILLDRVASRLEAVESEMQGGAASLFCLVAWRVLRESLLAGEWLSEDARPLKSSVDRVLDKLIQGETGRLSSRTMVELARISRNTADYLGKGYSMAMLRRRVFQLWDRGEGEGRKRDFDAWLMFSVIDHDEPSVFPSSQPQPFQPTFLFGKKD